MHTNHQIHSPLFSSSWRFLTVSSGCSRRWRRKRIIFLLYWSGLCLLLLLLHRLLLRMGHRWILRSISRKLRRSWKSLPLPLRLRPKVETFTGCFLDVPVLVKAPTPLVSLPSSAFLISPPVISYAKSFPPLVSSPLRFKPIISNLGSFGYVVNRFYDPEDVSE